MHFKTTMLDVSVLEMPCAQNVGVYLSACTNLYVKPHSRIAGPVDLRRVIVCCPSGLTTRMPPYTRALASASGL